MVLCRQEDKVIGKSTLHSGASIPSSMQQIDPELLVDWQAISLIEMEQQDIKTREKLTNLFFYLGLFSKFQQI
jgi:hypothetical protein